jgi:hypothetical protein
VPATDLQNAEWMRMVFVRLCVAIGGIPTGGRMPSDVMPTKKLFNPGFASSTSLVIRL